MKPEGYGLEVSGRGMKISARDFDGARHALKTARQLAEAGRDGDGYYIQACKISDFPALAFRAMHLCIYPETTPADLEKRVRLAAYYKFNYVVLEPWGTFPFESHPELSFFNKAFSRSELRRIVDLAYSLGITPIPQLTVLGHASGGTNEGGKHAILTRSPKMAELLEPHGWSWCMSNPRAVKLLEEAVAEMHEFFGNPPVFPHRLRRSLRHGNLLQMPQPPHRKAFGGPHNPLPRLSQKTRRARYNVARHARRGGGSALG